MDDSKVSYKHRRRHCICLDNEIAVPYGTIRVCFSQNVHDYQQNRFHFSYKVLKAIIFLSCNDKLMWRVILKPAQSLKMNMNTVFRVPGKKQP